MKKTMIYVMRIMLALTLAGVCAISILVMLCYYREPVALIPALVAGVSFIGANMLLPVKH